MRRSRSLAIVLLGPALAVTALTGCGNDKSAPSPSETASSVPTTAKVTLSDLNKVQVSDAPGSSMDVKYDGVFGVTKFSRKILTKGKGTPAAVGDLVEVKYSAVNGRDKKVVDATKGDTPATFPVSNQQLKGLTESLKGVPAGSRVLSAVPPKDLFGEKGNQGGTITGKDTVIFVMDVIGVKPARAEGTKVPAKAGLPTVKLSASGKPTVTIPKSSPPKTLVAQTLIQGPGAAVKATDTLLVQYTGVNWRTGKEFDSSWKRGEAAPLSLDQVIPGWKKGLTGKKVGSQVLLVIPPADGYGSAGQPSAGIKGTDTLVFVIDILATTPAQ